VACDLGVYAVAMFIGLLATCILTRRRAAGDMWGLGVVLLMLLNGGRTPFGADGPLAPAMPVDDLQAQLDAHLVRYLQEASNDLVGKHVRTAQAFSHNETITPQFCKCIEGFAAVASLDTAKTF